jgi:hypothetical protein
MNAQDKAYYEYHLGRARMYRDLALNKIEVALDDARHAVPGSEKHDYARESMEYFLVINQVMDALKAELATSDPSQAGQD